MYFTFGDVLFFFGFVYTTYFLVFVLFLGTFLDFFATLPTGSKIKNWILNFSVDLAALLTNLLWEICGVYLKQWDRIKKSGTKFSLDLCGVQFFLYGTQMSIKLLYRNWCSTFWMYQILIEACRFDFKITCFLKFELAVVVMTCFESNLCWTFFWQIPSLLSFSPQNTHVLSYVSANKGSKEDLGAGPLCPTSIIAVLVRVSGESWCFLEIL